MSRKRSLWMMSACFVLLSGMLLLPGMQAARARSPRGSVVSENTPPVAEFTVDPTNGVVGTWFYFDPTGSHDEEDSLAWLQVSFDWTSDGEYDTGGLNPGNPFPRHKYDAVGTYTVRMEVRDRDGLTDTVEHDVMVGNPGSNTPPTARCEANPTIGTVNTVFTFSAATSSDEQDDASDLIARWDQYGGGQWITAWLPATAAQTFQFSRHGLKEVRLEVRDTGTLSDQTACEVEVQPEAANTPPTAGFTVSPSQGDTTTVFTFDPSSSVDLEDSLRWLTVQYDWTDDGTYDTLWRNGTNTSTHTYSAWGQLTTRMMVMDTGGLTDETTRTVTVEALTVTVYLPLLQR